MAQSASAAAFDRRRRRDSDPIARNDNRSGGSRCPLCNTPTRNAPRMTDYRGAGVLHHHWHCDACGHHWITETHVSV